MTDTRELIDVSELDNPVMRAEEMAMLMPTLPIDIIIRLCKEIQEDCENGHY